MQTSTSPYCSCLTSAHGRPSHLETVERFPRTPACTRLGFPAYQTWLRRTDYSAASQDQRDDGRPRSQLTTATAAARCLMRTGKSLRLPLAVTTHSNRSPLPSQKHTRAV